MHERLEELESIKKSLIVDSNGYRYLEFQKTLAPRWGVVWRDIAGGYLALGLVTMSLLVAQGLVGWLTAPLLILLGGVLYGFFLAYLNNFFHEAAHFNIAPNRRLNDILANLVIGYLTGRDIRPFRDVHFDHHRHLGTTEDPEFSYFDPLNLSFFLETILGLKQARLISNRMEIKAELSRTALATGMVMNVLILSWCMYYGWWVVGSSWSLGVLSFFPVFCALRVVLEHRNEHADSSVDYHKVNHGAVNRLFGDGPLASTLGSAGFNRHLLHHWASQISYTRLRELEEYLRDTQLGDYLESRKTTYAEAFSQLYNS